MPFSFQASEQRLGDELSRNACRNDFVVGLRFPITACGSKFLIAKKWNRKSHRLSRRTLSPDDFPPYWWPVLKMAQANKRKSVRVNSKIGNVRPVVFIEVEAFHG